MSEHTYAAVDLGSNSFHMLLARMEGEQLQVLDRLKEMVLQGCSTAELKAEMIAVGINSLRLAGIEKIRQGMTTIDEVLRVTAADNV